MEGKLEQIMSVQKAVYDNYFFYFLICQQNVSFININQFSYLYVATKTRNKVEKKLQINNFSIKDLFLCVTPTKTRFQVR